MREPVTKSPEVVPGSMLDAATWFDGLFDDAALFPPRRASPSEAVAGHLEWRRSAYRELVGPLVCSDIQLQEVGDLLGPTNETRIALTVSNGVSFLVTALSRAHDASLGVSQIEVPLSVDENLVEAASLISEAFARDGAYVEIPIGEVSDAVCSTLKTHCLRLKLRTGGATADAFPSVEALASALVHSVQHQLPFKLTAGLHGAVRHCDPQTGFEHHGFLNVMLATAAALRGSDESGVATILCLENGVDVATALELLPEGMASEVRALFTSFGTCSIDEPLEDLRALGLLARGA